MINCIGFTKVSGEEIRRCVETMNKFEKWYEQVLDQSYEAAKRKTFFGKEFIDDGEFLAGIQSYVSTPVLVYLQDYATKFKVKYHIRYDMWQLYQGDEKEYWVSADAMGLITHTKKWSIDDGRD